MDEDKELLLISYANNNFNNILQLKYKSINLVTIFTGTLAREVTARTGATESSAAPEQAVSTASVSVHQDSQGTPATSRLDARCKASAAMTLTARAQRYASS